MAIDQRNVAQIGQGLLVLLGVEKHDDAKVAERLVDKLLGYRVFNDVDGKMNLNIQQVEGELLLVPQFTLVADTKRGLRPGFSDAASPEQGRALFDAVVGIMRAKFNGVEQGQFGADMSVQLINDGPVTFWIQV